MLVFGVQAGKKIEHLARLTNRLPNVPKRVGELLEVAGVLGDVHVALDKIAVLGLQVHGAVKLVVAELILDGVPDEVGGGLGHADNGEDLFGDGVVEPAEDALIEDALVRITVLDRGRRRGKMNTEIELPDESIEEGAPLGVVGFGELKDDGNMGFDIHCLKDSGGGSGK
jgi:hypothetical protein